jgi:uncharacterized protein YcfJ
MSRRTWMNTFALAAVCMAPAWAGAQEVSETWARVVQAEPVRQEVRIPQRNNVCWDEQVQRVQPVRRSAAPQILGAIVGGVIGNQFGGGSGRDLMTMAGATLGASVAADAQYKKYPDRYYVTTERRCETRTEWRYEERIVAWDVTYEYNGVLYQSRMQQAPGDRIRIQVGVTPLDQ